MNRVALIAFDSPDLRLVERGLAEGRLPNFARVLEGGRFVELRENQEIVTAASWRTIVSAAPLDRHGLLYPTQLAPGTYRFGHPSSSDARVPPFWRHVSDAGRRSTIASIYGAELLAGFNGTQVVGWGSHDGYARDRRLSDPPALVKQLEKEFGPRLLQYGVETPEGKDDTRRYLEKMLKGCDQQAGALAALAERTEWDFFAGAFADCHQAGHYLWHLDFEEHFMHADVDPGLHGGLLDVYARTDAGIGRLLDALPDDTTVLVASPYSMGPEPYLGEVVGDVLERGGWLVRRDGQPRAQIADPKLRALALARRAVHATVPARLRPRLGRLVPRDTLVGALELADADWSRTRVFTLPGDGASFFRVNLRGREPEGSVEPGAHYEDTLDELTGFLASLVDADTGERLMDRAERFRDIFGSEPWGALPDLCVQWRRGGPPRAVGLPGGGEVEVTRHGGRKTLHWEPGFLLGHGPGIEASGSRSLTGPVAKLVDVGPTVLSLLGVDQPESLPGRPIEALAGVGQTGNSRARA